MSVTRRKFIRETAGWVVACCAVGSVSLLGSCTSVRYVNAVRRERRLMVKTGDLNERRFVIVNDPQLQAPVYLRKSPDGGYRAFLMLCTHKACDVKPAGAILVCPCHGSEFSGEGKVLKGPAAVNLLEYKVTHDTEHIYIEVE